jgi:putative sigma-54 modulation protein
MELLVRNAEGNIPDGEREYAARKLGKLERFLNQAQKVEMVHREDKLQHHVEITVFADGMTIRGEEHDSSLRAAIDKVSDKLENRLKRFKGRLVDRHRRKGNHVPIGLTEEPAAEEDSHPPFKLAEHKQFLVKPMSVEEAALQMEMVDHPFFVFRNEEDQQFAVLYKRKDGRYGIMHPEI